jgi:putative membrane protein
MSDLKEEYQQQILFTNTADNKLDKTDNTQQPMPENQQQVVFNNDDWQVDEHYDEQLASENAEQDLLSDSKPRRLWQLVFSLIFVLMIIEAFDYFSQGFIESPIATSIVATIFVCLTLITGGVLIRELSSLRQFKQQQNIKNKISTLLSAEDVIVKNKSFSATELCENISQNLPCDLQLVPPLDWQNLLSSEHNDKEIIQLYSRKVLTQVDQKAINEIAKFSTESVVLVALSPVAIIDMMIMFWRNLRMIDKIASLYGLKLGYWSRIRLIKQVFINMAYAGASEMLSDVGADMLGADILGKMSTRFAQGLGAGMLTARLGLRVLKLARPIAFNHPELKQDEPKIGLIRKAIINQVSALIKNKT